MGLGVVAPGTTAVSLGTSDTVFSLLDAPRVDPAGTAHVFGAPTGDFMSLVCFRNGSLARERVRDRFHMDWVAFSRALRQTPPGNNGGLMLPWFEAEITPTVDTPTVLTEGMEQSDAAGHVRACVEGQVLAMRRHSTWAAPDPVRIHATGGAARNPEILQVMADVFEAPVYRVGVSNAACLGAALRAAHVDLGARGPEGWEEVPQGFVETGSPVASPRQELAGLYRELGARHAALEARALKASRQL